VTLNSETTLEGFDGLSWEFEDLQTVEAPATILPAVMLRLGLADSYFSIETPIGAVFVASNPRGISAVMRADDGASFERAFREQFGRPVYPATDKASVLRSAVRDQLRGEPRGRLQFDIRGLSEFEQAVLRKALEIPRGEVRPYAWIAREIGHPRAVRAVGTALARNPIPLLIPCHRVVRSDGVIGRYGLGDENKHVILEEEGAQPAELRRLAKAGARFVGSATTHIFCFPTCRHARRVQARHQRMFASEAEASSRGFRPCKVCRPAPLVMKA
jgi:O-6-methylguanine DNA methyltransferase